MNIWLNRLIWLSTIILFAGLPFSKALISIGTGLLILSAIIHIYLRGKPKNAWAHRALLGLGLFYVFYLSSLLYSENFEEGLNHIFRQHAFVSIPLCIWILVSWFQTNLKILIRVFLASCAIHALLTIILFAIPEAVVAGLVKEITFLQPYPELTDRVKFGLYTPFIERLNLAYLIGFALLYMLYQFLVTSWKLYDMIQFLILGLAFLLIGARGAQIALIVALLFGSMIVLSNRLKARELPRHIYQQRLTSQITFLLIAIIGIPIIAFQTIPAVQKRYAQMQWELRLINNGDYVQEEYQYFTSLTRIRAWSNAWQIVKNNSFFGVGIGDYRNELKNQNQKHNDLVPVHNQNFFLYLWGSSGLLALLLLGYSVWRFLKTFDSRRPNLQTLVVAYLIFIGLSSLIDAFVIYHIGCTSVMLFLSSLYVLNLSGGEKDA